LEHRPAEGHGFPSAATEFGGACAQSAADFEPERFEDHYEEAPTELINAKRNGRTISTKPRPKGENVVDLMDALKKSIANEATPKGKKPRKASAGQRKCYCRSRERSPRRKRLVSAVYGTPEGWIFGAQREAEHAGCGIWIGGYVEP